MSEVGSLPLEGVRVIDFTWVIAGPLATRTLASMGADVIKVESRTRVDGIRFSLHSSDRSSYNGGPLFNDCNLGKRSVSINLSQPAGVDLVKRLIAKADVVVNNFSGTRMDRWGLGYRDLSRENSGLIMVSMPVMGTDGPLRDYRGNGNHVAALVGMNMSMGFEERPPMGSDVAYPDFVNPYHAAFAILAALHHRYRTGEGQFIDLAQYESTAAVMGPAVLELSANHVDSVRAANRDREMSPHDVYQCAPDDDGIGRWVAIAVRGGADWQRLCEELGRPQWGAADEFSTVTLRRSREREIDAVIGAWCRSRDAHAAAAALQARGVPAGVAQDVRDLVDRDAHWAQRQLDVVWTGEASVFCQAETIRLDGARIPSRPAPDLGAHTHEVLRDVLGLDDQAIRDLESADVLT